MFVGTLMLPIGLLITGWTVEARAHWIAPDIVSVHIPPARYLIIQCNNQGIALVGAGIILNFQCIQTYVIDAFTLYAASGVFKFLCKYAGLVAYYHDISLRSVVCDLFLAFFGRVWVSSVCACNVLYVGVR